jgi:glycosyltransferase involved in cell wall biosynthesis
MIPRILIIMNYRHGRGGLTGAVDELVLSLTEEGYHIKIVSTHGNVLQRLSGVRACFKAAPKYDLILGVGCSYVGFFPIMVASIVSSIFHKSVVYNFHSGEALAFLKRCYMLIRIFIGSRPVVTASEFVTNAFGKYNFNAVRIPYHFNYNRNFITRRVSFSWNNRVLFVRGFHEIYQPELALSAAKHVLAQNKDYEFHFFGGGKLKERLEAKYKHANIIFRGFLARKILLREYGNFSILINTSLYDNFPLSIVEAGYNELLVISTRIGGIATIFDDSEVLFFDDAGELQDLLFRIAEDPARFDSLRKRLHMKVLSFTWENVRLDWMDVFNNALLR